VANPNTPRKGVHTLVFSNYSFDQALFCLWWCTSALPPRRGRTRSSIHFSLLVVIFGYQSKREISSSGFTHVELQGWLSLLWTYYDYKIGAGPRRRDQQFFFFLAENRHHCRVMKECLLSHQLALVVKHICLSYYARTSKFKRLLENLMQCIWICRIILIQRNKKNLSEEQMKVSRTENAYIYALCKIAKYNGNMLDNRDESQYD